MSNSYIAQRFAIVFLVSAALRAPLALGAALPPSIQEWCKYLAAHLKSVNVERCMKREWIDAAESARNRPIPRFRRDAESGKPPSDKEAGNSRIMVIGAIHGDEITAVSVVFRWIELLEREKFHPELKKHSYLFVPLANPDGFYASPRTRTNSNSVDLNRNFATKEWGKKALAYWKSQTLSDPRRNPGKAPASEVETKLVQRWIDEFKPNLIISVHAPYKVVDHDGPIEFPAVKSPLPVRTLGAYPGSLGTYAGIDRDIPVVTPELPDAIRLPNVKDIEDLFLFIMKSKY